MIQISKENYTQFSAGELQEGLDNGTMNLAETGISALVEITRYICSAVGERKRLRVRVEVLENAVKHQQDLIEKIAAKLPE